MALFSEQDLARLAQARNLWLATVRADGSPHLVPIWFVWLNDSAYICTAHSSVKARNLSHNPNAAFSLEDGDQPLVVQARVEFLEETPTEVVAAFQEKFNWNIEGDSTYNAVIRLIPLRRVL